MFRFDNLVGVLFNEEGKAKLKKYEHTGLKWGFVTFFVVVFLVVLMDTNFFTNFNIIDFLSKFSISNYVFVPGILAFIVGCSIENRIRYNIIKKYGKVIEYSVEMRVEDEGIYVTYLDTHREVFFRREDLFIDVIKEPKYIRKYLGVTAKSFVELSYDDNEIKIPIPAGDEFYGIVYERYPERFPDYGEDEE